MQEGMLEMLYSDAVKCNVVITSHITFGEDTANPGIQRGFPSALGTKLPPKVGSYFNSIVAVEKQSFGSAITRTLRTQATHNMELKNSKPSVIPVSMEPDLAKFFAYLKGTQTPPVASAAGSGGANVASPAFPSFPEKKN